MSINFDAALAGARLATNAAKLPCAKTPAQAGVLVSAALTAARFRRRRAAWSSGQRCSSTESGDRPAWRPAFAEAKAALTK